MNREPGLTPNTPGNAAFYQMKNDWIFWLKDMATGLIVGAGVGLAHYLLVPSKFGEVVSMLLGMIIGMGVQMFLCLLLGFFSGGIEAMIPGMFVGMIPMLLPLFHLKDLRMELILSGHIGLLTFLFFAGWNEMVKGKCLWVLPPGPSQKGGVASLMWNGPGWLYDTMQKGATGRQAPFQKELFRTMEGKVLFVAAGTGLNFPNFPPGKKIWAIDLSKSMVKAARAKVVEYEGSLSLQQADVQTLPFASSSFDTVATACTFCSVVDPVQGLTELYRVLKENGKLLMFEHVRSRNWLLGLTQDFLTLVSRYIGPSMNRDTVGNVQRAGFTVDRAVRAYLDIFLTIEAHKPSHGQVSYS